MTGLLVIGFGIGAMKGAFSYLNDEGILSMNRKILFTLAALSLSASAIGATSIGIVSCASWLHPETNLERIVNERWVVGFASGMNVMNSTLTKGAPDELSRFKSSAQIFELVNEHCTKTPVIPISQDRASH